MSVGGVYGMLRTETERRLGRADRDVRIRTNVVARRRLGFDQRVVIRRDVVDQNDAHRGIGVTRLVVAGHKLEPVASIEPEAGATQRLRAVLVLLGDADAARS